MFGRGLFFQVTPFIKLFLGVQMSSNTYSFGSVGIFLTYNHHTCLYIWCISQVVTILINACVWSDFVITQAFFSFLLHGHSIESTEGERGAHRTAAEGARPWEGRGRPGRRPGRWGGQSWQYFTLHITFVKQRYWRQREKERERITSCIGLS